MEFINLAPSKRMTVDNLHFVVMGEGIRYKRKKFGGWKSIIFSGEGFVIELE